jgi:hypothetical protein
VPHGAHQAHLAKAVATAFNDGQIDSPGFLSHELGSFPLPSATPRAVEVIKFTSTSPANGLSPGRATVSISAATRQHP